MGQKVNPISFRLQVHKNWSSRWFAGKKDFATWLAEDIRIRELIEKRFEARPTIGLIEIERSANLPILCSNNTLFCSMNTTYTLGFLFFWLICMGSSVLTYLLLPPRLRAALSIKPEIPKIEE